MASRGGPLSACIGEREQHGSHYLGFRVLDRVAG